MAPPEIMGIVSNLGAAEWTGNTVVADDAGGDPRDSFAPIPRVGHVRILDL